MSELQKLRNHLLSKPRDLLLLEIALRTQVPVQDILNLRLGDLQNLEVGDPLPANLSKDSGFEMSKMTDEIKVVLNQLIKEGQFGSSKDYLFQSRKGKQPLSPQSVSRLIRSWRDSVGIKGIHGLPGLRQAQRHELGEKIEKVGGTQVFQNTTSCLPKIKNKTIQETVYDELEGAILSGDIAPGQKLVTEEIARMMDVSRIPVREAMGRLAARGLISTRPKWGSIVNKLSRENLEEISEIRLLLEPEAAVKAVTKATDDFVKQLEQAQQLFAKARLTTKTRELLESNRRFHFLIYAQANSPELLNLISQLWDKVSPYYHIMFGQSLEESPTVGVSYHEKIVAAFVARNLKDVKYWLTADLVDSTKYILALFDKYE
jgi:DNA-binding GntR family transcriptional regulator